jgi:succinate-acetate transporter protein
LAFGDTMTLSTKSAVMGVACAVLFAGGGLWLTYALIYITTEDLKHDPSQKLITLAMAFFGFYFIGYSIWLMLQQHRNESTLKTS